MSRKGKRTRGKNQAARAGVGVAKRTSQQLVEASRAEAQDAALQRVLHRAKDTFIGLQHYASGADATSEAMIATAEATAQVLHNAVASLRSAFLRADESMKTLREHVKEADRRRQTYLNAARLVASCIEPEIAEETATAIAATNALAARVAELEEANRRLQDRLRAPQAPAAWLRRLLGSFRRREDVPNELWPSIIDTIMERTIVGYFDTVTLERMSAGQTSPDDAAVQERKAAIKAALEAFDRTVGGMNPDDEPAVRLMWDIVQEYVLALGWDGREFVAELAARAEASDCLVEFEAVPRTDGVEESAEVESPAVIG